MMMSQILKSVDFIKTRKFRYLENKTVFFFLKKKSYLHIKGYFIVKNSFVVEVTFNNIVTTGVQTVWLTLQLAMLFLVCNMQ